MKIIHFIPTLNPRFGGPVTAVIGLANALRKSGHTSIIISAEGAIDPSDYRPENFDATDSKKWGYFFNRHIIRAAYQHMINADLVHIHTLWTFTTLMGCRMANIFSLPYILTPHGMLTPWSLDKSWQKKILYFKMIEKQHLSRAAALHFFSENELYISRGVPENAKTIIIPNGIEEQDKYMNKDEEKRKIAKRYPQTKDKIIILFLGRLHSGKGIDVLLPALSQLSAVHSNVVLLLAGPDADFGEEIRKRIAHLKLSEYVLQVGLVIGKEKGSLLRAADIFVLPSRHEGDSLSIKEAMQAGLPMIISPYCNADNVVKEKTGMIVPLQVASIANALCTLIENPILRKEMGERGKILAKKKFLWSKIAIRFLEEYHRILH